MATSQLVIRLLGPLTVLRDDVPVSLPQSQKTRALLAYLVATQRPQRRERLAALLWDLTEDPRAALRWSVSKLRILDDDDAKRIRADRDAVAFEPNGAWVDVLAVRNACAEALSELPIDRLQALAAAFRGEFLDNVELPELDEFQAWRVAMREEFRRAHRRLLGELVARNESNPERSLDYARELVRLAPEDETNRATLVRLLVASGRREEAEEHYVLGRKQIERCGEDRHELFAVWRTVNAKPAPSTTPDADAQRQRIEFCVSEDGTRIAFAKVGEGLPLVKTANWMSHLEYDWKCPLWRHLARELAREFELIRYDQRGNGLSDWEVETFSLQAGVADLNAVVEATGAQRFALLGVSGGCRVAIEYALHHAERVSHLVLYGGAARGWKHFKPSHRAMRAGLQASIRHGWGSDRPAFRQLFTTLFMPDASAEQMTWFNELQRVSASADNAYRMTEASGDDDIMAHLANISVPTLVMHATGDAMVPFDEGRLLAASIPNARFVALPSNNHLLLDDEPAFARFLWEIRSFVKDGVAAPAVTRRDV